MNKQDYDERQLSLRHRASTQALFLLVFLVFVNGFVIDTWGAWGTGLEQSMTVTVAALVFFSLRVIWSGAYFTSKLRWGSSTVAFAMVSVISIGIMAARALSGQFSIWQAGHAGPDWLPLVMLVFTGSAAIASLARPFLDARAEA